jgi:hypothetical protein
MRSPVPPLLQPHSSDEYAPVPWNRRQRRAVAAAQGAADRHRGILGLSTDAYLADRRGTAATLRALDAGSGGGFYRVPVEAEIDGAAADAAFAATAPGR